MLFDSTCAWLQACVSACKMVNGLPPTLLADDVQYDSARDLSHETYNVIKVYTNGKPVARTARPTASRSRSAVACTASTRAACRCVRSRPWSGIH